ncbi:MAG TPA: ABC-type transport auxiliary lipoprotein family protein [Steroidobacteraceae bacterium]|nr:ABC-type transport auxiliary lipoprotein family protein [Steroidobacteraceae bacterium]
MNGWRILLAASITLSLAACALGRPIPQATTYIVDPAGEIAPVPRRPERLRMGQVRVAAAYAGSGLVYRLDEVRYAIDPYHAFVADPGAMLGGRIAEWLDRTGPFSTVSPPGSAQPAPYVLDATVEELYGDFRAGAGPAAVLCVQFALIDQASARPKVVYERTIASRVRLQTASPDALIGGYGTALAQILSQVAVDLSTQIPR